MRIEIVLPVKVVSELNLREHWTKKHKRHKNLHKAILLLVKPRVDQIHIPCCVTLIRVAGRVLDEDNLIGAFKPFRDYIADLLIPGLPMGRADHDPRITWRYRQERGLPGQYACKIVIEDQNDVA